jgi:hypothetical protein
MARFLLYLVIMLAMSVAIVVLVFLIDEPNLLLLENPVGASP